LDALIVINVINEGGSTNSQGELIWPTEGELVYIDVSHDGFLAPNDALMIVNSLNGEPVSGEGESHLRTCEGKSSMLGNIFDDLPSHLPDELIQTLVHASDVRIERIISHGHASAVDFWYDQPEHEWVIVLKGAARLQFADGMIDMKPGDCINIPAHKKHRVDWTTSEELTIWLGVRYGGEAT
jgi:cupin 2 domain-containing protein